MHPKLLIIFLALKVVSFSINCNFDYSQLNYQTSGYVKHEAYGDTRQIVGARNDHFLLYPAKQLLDKNDDDINSQGQAHIVAFESRIRTTIDGATINNANTNGVIEADFFGKALSGSEIIDFNSIELTNLFRLRHAYMKFNWENFILIAGQTWHPTFVPECFPDTISFNTGSPMEIYGRNPLIEGTYHTKHLDIIACIAMQQEDFSSDGPDGFSTKYMHNAIIPNLHGQVKGRFGNDHVIGAAIDFKRLRPRIVTNNNFKTGEYIDSIVTFGYLRLSFDNLYCCTKIIYAENAHDYGTIGGYAVHSIDQITDKRTYTNTRAIATFFDCTITKHNDIKPGFMIGYVKNIGANKTIIDNLTDENNIILQRRIFGIGMDVDNVFRIAPRLRWYINNITIAGEIEYTRAAFGTRNSKAKVKNTTPETNIRLLFAIFYNF